DGDGVPDDQDAFPNDPNESSDSDGDGIGDNSDTCDSVRGITTGCELPDPLVTLCVDGKTVEVRLRQAEKDGLIEIVGERFRPARDGVQVNACPTSTETPSPTETATPEPTATATTPVETPAPTKEPTVVPTSPPNTGGDDGGDTGSGK